MNHDAEFRRCLIELDVIGICDLWFHVAPGLPQPKDNEEALVSLHYARTMSQSIPARLRCYSHSWLLERNYPSGLPDHLKPKADRMYPRVVTGVGISVVSLSPSGAERAAAIQKTMENAVLECYADGVIDPVRVKARMAEARRRLG